MMTQAQARDIWDKIKDIKVAMLVSRDGAYLRARPMHHVQKEFSGTLWFFTRADAAKAEEIARNPDICLSYEDRNSENYVSLSGSASVTRDRGLIEKFWNPFIAAWFPEGKDSPEIALLEVHIERAEYWDGTASRMVQLYETLRANLTGTQPDMGKNRKVG